MKIAIDPKKEIFRWGPIDGKLIYPDFFNIAFTKFPKNFTSWPDVLWLMEKEKMTCVLENDNLVKSGQKNFYRFVVNDKKFKKNYLHWQKILKNWLQLQKTLSADQLKNLTNQKLYEVFKKWSGNYLDFWTIGLLPEIANYGSEIILKEKLQVLIPKKDFIHVFEKLSAPDRLSFYQKADLDLFKLKKFIGNPKIFDQKISHYQKNYFWILNSYHHTQILTKDYFKKELLKHSGQNLNKKINELEIYSKKVKKTKQDLVKKYKIDNEVVKIANRLAFCIWWQDLRKYYIFLANYHLDLFLNEFSKRYLVDFKKLQYYGGLELLALAKNQVKISNQEINRRRKNLVVHYSESQNSLEYISGAPAKKIINQYKKNRITLKTKEFRGLVVSRGKVVKGRVRILKSAADFSKMKKGEILVTPMTAPDYIMAIKKASAIVTDEGGMTSHAAIVSRELKIPCVVGTKIATKLLKNGDLIQVDTSQGIIKKINS